MNQFKARLSETHSNPLLTAAWIGKIDLVKVFLPCQAHRVPPYVRLAPYTSLSCISTRATRTSYQLNDTITLRSATCDKVVP